MGKKHNVKLLRV